MRQTLPGLQPRTLSRYLAAVGMVRALSRHDLGEVQISWAPDGVVVESTVGDLVEWLVDEYRPAPIISPWSGGSGYKDGNVESKKRLAAIEASATPRLQELIAAIKLGRRVLDRSAVDAWAKARTVRELRNRCSEDLLPWIDAAVVLQHDQACYPPLLGTGGNDGRLDFSTNYHQCLLEVIPDVGADRAASVGWARDLLAGTSITKLPRGTGGQFDPGAGGPNSTPVGDQKAGINPWEIVLMMEGTTWFAASAARRHGTTASRAAMPFCVAGSSDGPTPGAPAEDSRGEVWCPIWHRPMTTTEMVQLFAEARATWQGRVAVQSAQMYAALASYGVANGIDRFLRFGIVQRYGFSYVAVLLDDVTVKPRPPVKLLAAPQQVIEPFSSLTSTAAVTSVRRFRRAELGFARSADGRDLRDLLAAQTQLDLHVSRSDQARRKITRRRRPPSARAYLDHWMSTVDCPELRVAVAFAALAFPRPPDGSPARRYWSMRDVLVGTAPTDTTGWQPPRVPGLGVRPLAEVLARVATWYAAQSKPAEAGNLGVRLSEGGVAIPWPDLHAWARGDLDDREVEQFLMASLALDWREVRELNGGQAPASMSAPLIDPPLAVLQRLAAGVPLSATGQGADRGATGKRFLQPDWPARLVAGRVDAVLQSAIDRLRQLGWSAAPPLSSGASGVRLAAALLPRPDTQPTWLMGIRRPSADEATSQSTEENERVN